MNVRKSLSSRIRYAAPRVLTFKDWYKTLFPLNRFLNSEHKLHLRNGLIFHVRDMLGTDVAVILDLFYNDEYHIDEFNLGENPRVLDLGANIGSFTKLIKFKYPSAEVYAFEPSLENFRFLQKNTKGQAILSNTAVTGNDGTSNLYFTKEHTASTIIRDNVNPKVRDPHIQSITNTPLRRILSEVGNIDLMKMDIEGSEYDALLNTDANLLKRIKNILIELHSGHSSYTMDDLAFYIQKLGFKMVRKESTLWWFKNTNA